MLFGKKIITYCTSKIYQDTFCDFISSFNTELVEHDWRVLVFCSATDLYKDNKNNQAGKNIFDLINYDISDAILISDENLLDEELKKSIIQKAHDHNIPVIVIEGTYEDTYNIHFNQQAGFEQVVRHIIDVHEKTTFHFIAGTKDSIQSKERLEVFKSVLKEKKIPFNTTMLSYGDFWDLPTRIATQKLIDSGQIPEAIICANDTMALTVISVLEQNGFLCPDDVLVTGFDGIQAAFFSNPKITTSFCDHHQLGTETAKFLFKITESSLPLCSTYISPSLIVSESCGCKPIKNSKTLEFINFLTDSYNRYMYEDTSLSNLAVEIQECKSIEEVRTALKSQLLYNVSCMVKEECIDINTIPTINHTSSTYGDVQYVLIDSDCDDIAISRFIKTKDLAPRMEDLINRYKMPIIFSPLNNLDHPIGYLCFTFCSYERQNYTRIAQISSWLGSAISGYRNVQYLQHLQNKIENMYKHDALTGLYNRTGFQKIYKKILDDPSIKTLSLVMCDLDNLKYINDNFSHNEGDVAICAVGNALSTAYSDGFFCRYGGDEIIGLFTHKIDSDELNKKIEDYLNNYNETSGKPYEVSTSVGVYTSKKTSFEEMFGKADKLMYEQKLSKKRSRGQK